MYGHAPDEDSKKVDEAFLQEQTPGYEKPWIGEEGGDDSEKISGLLRSRKKRNTLARRTQV